MVLEYELGFIHLQAGTPLVNICEQLNKKPSMQPQSDMGLAEQSARSSALGRMAHNGSAVPEVIYRVRLEPVAIIHADVRVETLTTVDHG